MGANSTGPCQAGVLRMTNTQAVGLRGGKNIEYRTIIMLLKCINSYGIIKNLVISCEIVERFDNEKKF